MHSERVSNICTKNMFTLTKCVTKVPRFVKYLLAIFLTSLLVLWNKDIIGYKGLSGNFRNPYNDEKQTIGVLRDDLASCFLELSNYISEGSDLPKTSSVVTNRLSPSLLTIVSDFYTLLSSLHIKAAIIEPSVLYCSLLSQQKKLLLKRKFDITKFLGSNNILTFGILSEDVQKLQKEGNIDKFSRAGFRPYFVQDLVAEWMKAEKLRFPFETFASHIFYKHKIITFHLVVFQGRANYLWHAELLKTNKKIPLKKDLLFVNHNGAYEKFAFIPLKTNLSSSAEFYIPSMPHHFLFQMLSSRFLECDSSRSENLTSKGDGAATRELSVESFNKRTVVAIQQLKIIFHPLLMNIWIWSGTMLGWYRQCDIIPYTTDVDMAAWASEIEDVNHIINSLLKNEYVKIKSKFGLLEEALEFQVFCYGLQTDIFFHYSINNGSWCSGHRASGGYYFRYYYPHFTLCSAELLGQKVQVPCETEKVIRTEYGPNWSKPVSSWSYETSTSNRGPNIYWKERNIKNFYDQY